MTGDARLRLVVDNQAEAGLAVEHGFAAWIEAGGRRLLLDSGAGGALVANAAALGIDLAAAEAVVLSHGHYDHSGGLPQVLAVAADAVLYGAPGIGRARFSCPPGRPPRAIGMAAEVRARIEALPPARRVEVREPLWLAPGIGLTGPIPRWSGEDAGGPFFLDPAAAEADPLDDDQALWLETAAGVVIVVGCCHAGLINTVERVRAVSGIDRVAGIVGGFHLLNADEARLADSVARLRAWAPDFVVPCHCSGAAAVARLGRDLGGTVVRPGRAGLALGLGRLCPAGAATAAG
ncbi:MBL fold metallo-hydrolase [Phaeospirillum tilakii]|uniref:MBL fold metallo-hydrolase n=1 Tax=Phaeospirillum tilakii TaxID=741673 RepID=A0ABW5CAS2_9PROT